MSPAPIRPHDLNGQPSTSLFTHETEIIHAQSKLYPRSNVSRGIGGVQDNTIIFIIVGVVCLFVILTGFYIVSRHASSKAARETPCSPPQQSPITQPPSSRGERSTGAYWKLWKIGRRTNNTVSPPPLAVAELPTFQISAPPDTPSPTFPPTVLACPSMVPRPSNGRRVTSLSVTTSFSHSHITQEALNDFRVSAYDLDGDLETEMLNSAREDVFFGHILGTEDGCGKMGIEETMDECGNANHGGVQGHPCTGWQGDDYENSGACQDGRPGGNDGEKNVVETVENSVG